MARVIRVTLWLVVVGGLAAAGAWWFWGRGSDSGEAPYRSEKVTRGDVQQSVTATGTLSAVITVQVGSQVSGIIARLHADYNSRVQKGQLLAEIDPANFEARVEQRRADRQQAQVRQRNAQVALRRQERLRAEGLTAEADYDAARLEADTAQTAVQQAQALLEQAETDLRNTRIVSPIDGIVVARQYDVGQTVAASFQAPTLFTIAQDLRRMQVEADIDQADIGRIHVDQDAQFTVDAYPDTTFRGTITQVRLNAKVNQNVVTYPVIITVDNPEEKLRPQMTADVSVVVAEAHDVLRVPNAALRFKPPETAAAPAPLPAPAGTAAAAPATQHAERRGSGSRGEHERRAEGAPRRRTQTVYVLQNNTQLRPVEIETGISDGRVTEVRAGDLKEGDEVATGLPTARTESSNGSSRGRPPGMRGF
ncbi:MAG: efflux RND transporter periplasmic adaptor subunit [Acidobacteria bacterium]|nr:efflux RND transporter periplasmic adaptor subunit [Acidobacteriota bacterium]